MNQPTSMERLLRPKSIAVIGGTIAAAVIRQCEQIGYQGHIWPIHPQHTEMAGRPCYSNVDDLPNIPDAAFIAVPKEATVAVVGALAEQGAGGAVCYASGFAELDAEGVALQQELQKTMGDLAVVGPNCYGLLNYLDGVTLWPDEHGGQRVDSGVAVIAQSGNLGISISMQQRSLSLAYLISTGNQAGVTIPQYVEALLDDERVTAIGIHMEGLNDIAAFSRAALKALKKKVPIVVLKSGSSQLGSQMTMSHTRSLAGADTLYDALFKRFGVVRVHTLPQFLETLKLLSTIGPLPNEQIASISCSGGEAVLVADTAAKLGLTMPALNAAQEDGLSAVLDHRVALSNPLDYHTYIWDDEEAQFRCFSAMLLGEQSITLKILDYPRPEICDPAAWRKTARAFSRAVRKTDRVGVVVSTLPENLPPEDREKLLAEGIVPMLGLEECLIAILGAAQVYAKQQALKEGKLVLEIPENPELIPESDDILTLDEQQSKALLQEYDLPTPRSAICTAGDAAQVAKEIGFPVVVKVLSDTIIHKSDVGGVHLNLQTAEAVQAAVDEMAALGDRFLVEAMAPKPLVELILGVTSDPQFGLALIIGAGGILVELFQDSKTLLFPVQRAEVEEAIEALKIAPLLNGYRGQPVANKQALIDGVMALAKLAEDHAEMLVDIDINPLFVYGEDSVSGQGILAVDGVIRKVKYKDEP